MLNLAQIPDLMSSRNRLMNSPALVFISCFG
jgi:hypothetical protein